MSYSETSSVWQGMRFVVLFALSLLLLSCAPVPITTTSTGTSPQAPSPTTSAVMPTKSVPTPMPLTGQLDPAPKNCPIVPAPATMAVRGPWGGFSGDVTFVGKAPVWIFDFAGALNDRSHPVLHLSKEMVSSSYPGTKILWEVGPKYPEVVTVRATDMQTGELAWWDMDGQHATSVMRLTKDMGSLHHGEVVSGWQEWGSTLHILKAGCYKLEVSWPKGLWSMQFAAGS